MSMHPIGKLYRSGVDVTINSDDVLIFDSDVSKEYLRLYESQCLTAEELENIRKKWTKTYNYIDKLKLQTSLLIISKHGASTM